MKTHNTEPKAVQLEKPDAAAQKSAHNVFVYSTNQRKTMTNKKMKQRVIPKPVKTQRPAIPLAARERAGNFERADRRENLSFSHTFQLRILAD